MDSMAVAATTSRSSGVATKKKKRFSYEKHKMECKKVQLTM